MNGNEGWIKLHSRILKWEWYDSPETLALWVYILLKANYKPTRWRGELFEEGSFPTSLGKLARETGLSAQQVRTCLDRLKSTNEITVKSTSKGTKICVVKWADYQGRPDDDNTQSTRTLTNEQQTSNKRSTTITEVQNIRSTDNKNTIPPTLEEVRQYCLERENGIDPEEWYDFYLSKNWMIGKSKMKDFKACIRTWEKRRPKPAPETKEDYYTQPWLQT